MFLFVGPSESLPQTQKSSLRCALSFQPYLGGVYVRRIYSPYLFIMFHLSHMGYHQLEHMHLDAAPRSIRLDTSALHGVIVCYCLIVFCQPTSRVGCQVGDNHIMALACHGVSVVSWFMALTYHG
jgi:hypothetical protein